MHVGCSALSHETAQAFGDEQRVLRAIAGVNVADPDEVAGVALPKVLEGKSPAERSRILRFMATPAGRRFGHDFDTERAAWQFVEEVALGPGAWELLPPPPVRATMIKSAPAFRVEQRDPAWDHISPGALAGISCPVTLTQGDASPPWFRPVVARLAELVPHARVHEYPGAGHAPHATHPADWCEHVSFVLGLRGAIR